MIPQIWNKKTYQEYITYLKESKEIKYQEFQKKLCFTNYEIIGIRIPLLRKIAKQISTTDIKSFLELNTNKYYEEIMIEGFVIANIKQEEMFDKYLYKHIKKIDDWSLCDCFCNSIKQVSKNKIKYFPIFKELALNKEEFISRVGLITILSHFTTEEYVKDIFKILDKIKTDKYYINMAEAWLVCELYIKFPKETNKYLLNNKLNNFTHNKSISKIRESYRVTLEEKEYLNNLKRKKSM